MRHEKILLCLGGFVISALMFSGCALFNCGGTKLVDEGKPCADIVIAEKPPRGVKLAASELQTYIEKISGAKLAITTSPGADVPAHIYVGRSAYTDKLNIMDEGLKHGAFRMVSGKGWLVLLGYDKDFVIPQYVARSYADIPRALKEWDERTGEHWGNPYAGARLYREYNAPVGVSMYDERGSFNAVCEFLRSLGVRWYMPGDLGEIVPALKTISLASMDKTVKPDFPYRNLGDYSPTFDCATRDAAMYILRLGRDPVMGIPGPHGLCNVNGRDEVRKAHPEFYADRTATSNYAYYASCLSSPELFDYTVKYARAVFDIYPDLEYISLMPNDGFYNGNMCQCELCKGQNTPQRGGRGDLSDYVWGFVDRVARELYKTHPDRKIMCNSYGAYSLPPEKIAKFSPNLVVQICEPRYSFNNPGERAKALELRKGFLDKLVPGNFSIYCHYLDSGSHLPSYYPHAIAEDLHSLKGISQGEYIELAQQAGAQGMHAPGFNHLNVYVTMRYYWDADQDIEALLNEYYEKFYGPAAKEMKAFIEYSEANWQKMSGDAAPTGKALELLDAARKAAGDTVYGKRIDLVMDYCQKPMTELRDRLSKDRKDVSKARIFQPPANDSEITIDGRFDEPRWNNGNYGWGSYAYGLAELETGRRPFSDTSFRVVWGSRAIYFGIRCEEPDMKNLNIATTNNDDPAIFKGDYVDVLLETQGHSYYQIAVNPAGAVFDADMKDGTNLAWSSSAKVAVFKGDSFWNVEMRIPVGDMMDGGVDPMKSVEGRAPNSLYPWAINLCRQRVSSTETERSAWSPTGTNSFYVPMKFGVLDDSWSEIGGHGRADYLSDRKAALALVQAGKDAEALTAFTNMAGNVASEIQKSDALELAAECANRLKQYDKALELAKAIPLPAVSKKCRMNLLQANRKYSELLAEFKTEDIDHWPESARGEAFFSRGQAFVQLKDGPAAEADLKKAAEYSRERHTPGLAWLMLGNMCRDLLKDDQKALEAYGEGIKMVSGGGGYSYTMEAVLSAADILCKQGKYDEALEVLKKIDFKKMEGYWGVTFRCAYGETLASQGKKTEAIAKFNEALGVKDATAAQKAACEKRIKELQGKTE